MTGRGLAGRRLARVLLIAVIVLDLMTVLLLTAAPATMGPAVNLLTSPLVVGGIGLNVVGLAWMVRIVRSDPEGGPSAWRPFRR